MTRRRLAVDDASRALAVSALVDVGVACSSLRAHVGTARERPARLADVSDELVHVRTTDGITNGGVIFTVRSNSPRTVAVIWVHGQTVNFYEPTYLNIGRELASRGYTTIAGNTRMHDLGNVAGYRGQARIRGGAYWGVPTEQVRDLAAWIGFAEERGFRTVVLVGHSAGAPAVQVYQSETRDPRVGGLVIASGRVRPVTTPPDSGMLAQAARLVAEGRGEELVQFPKRATPAFTSAATFLDISNNWPKDFFGVEQPNAPVTRIACPILAWFGTKEADVGTRADLELLQRAASAGQQGRRAWTSR